jgi:hypothetical protein
MHFIVSSIKSCLNFESVTQFSVSSKFRMNPQPGDSSKLVGSTIFVDDFSDSPSSPPDSSPAPLQAQPNPPATHFHPSPEALGRFAPIADLSLLIRPPIPQSPSLLKLLDRSNSAPDFQDGAPIPIHRAYTPNPASADGHSSLPMSPSECQRERTRSRSHRETVNCPLFGPEEIPASVANRKILALARRIRFTYRNFDSERFRSQLSLKDSLEKQFFDLLHAGECGDFADLHRTLTSQGVPQAIEHCLDHSMWGFALILARSISVEEFHRVSELFMRETFSETSLLSATMRMIGGLPSERDWKSTLANCLLNFNEGSPAVLAELYRRLEEEGEREAAEVVRMFAQMAAPATVAVPEVRAEEVKKGWFENLLRKLKPNSQPGMAVPPPPIAVESEPVLQRGNRFRASDRYVNPF